MKMTIYLPDDLGERVKEATELNVSAVCQDALSAELERRARLAELDEGMTRQTAYISQEDLDVAFVGKELAYEERAERTAYLTRHHRIAVVDHSQERLDQYDTFRDFADAYEDGLPGFVSEVAVKLGEKYILELDI